MQNTTTSDVTGTINGSVDANDDPIGTFNYRSHTTAIITNQTYDVAPASPNFGWAMAAWNAGNAPNLQPRIEGRDANAP